MTYTCEDCEEVLDTLQQIKQHYVHIHRKYVENHDIVDDDQLTISLEGASCVSRTARPSQLVRTGRIQSVWT